MDSSAAATIPGYTSRTGIRVRVQVGVARGTFSERSPPTNTVQEEAQLMVKG